MASASDFQRDDAVYVWQKNGTGDWHKQFGSIAGRVDDDAYTVSIDLGEVKAEQETFHRSCIFRADEESEPPKARTVVKSEAESARKRMKPSPTVLTFGASHSPVKVQLLSSHTIYDLCDAFCEYTSIGDGGSVDSHMWNVTIEATGRCYESGDEEVMSTHRADETKIGDLELRGPNATMRWMYDYGSTSNYQLTLLEVRSLTDEDSDSDFPRKLEAAPPAGYVKYSQPQASGVDLNKTFAHLNKWGFVEGERVSLNLFQPPQKHNHGFLERDNDGVRHMILMPAAPPKDLAAYLQCLDAGVSLGKPKIHPEFKCPEYNWYSMIIIPANSVTDSLNKRWGKHQEPGFHEMKLAPVDTNLPSLNSTFPKLAALAGFVKDKKVPKGWLTFQDGTLRICTGKSKSPKSKAPDSTAFFGIGQHEPATEDGVLLTMCARADSLHDLFCVAEGLLRCL